jgi:hypothetical protein
MFHVTQSVALGYDELPRWGNATLFRADSMMIGQESRGPSTEETVVQNGSCRKPDAFGAPGLSGLSTNICKVKSLRLSVSSRFIAPAVNFGCA